MTYGAEVTLKLSNLVNNSYEEISFRNKLLLTNTHVLRPHKAFANGSSANVKLFETQLHKIGQSRGFLGRILKPLLKMELPLTKNILKPLAKNVLIPLG